MDPNETYNRMLAAISNLDFIAAREQHCILADWLQRGGFQPRWREIPEGWNVEFTQVPRYEVPAGLPVNLKTIVYYSLQGRTQTGNYFGLVGCGMDCMEALRRFTDDLETLTRGKEP